MDRRSFTQSVLGSSLMIINKKPVELRKRAIYLKKGDKIGLICPAGIINEERLDKAMANMETLGLKAISGKYILEQSGYLAGSDQHRLADLHNMYSNSEIAAVWCIRGGYGCTRLLPYVDFDLIKSNPKPMLGYSDITAFHHAINLKAGVHTFHSPVGSSELTPYTLSNLKSVIFGESGNQIEIETSTENDQLFADGKSVYERYIIHPGIATGNLWGGNLSLLAAMAGTEYLKLKKDSILFIEDIEEVPYRIDRMLTQLFQALPMNKIKGIVVGVCEGCEKKDNGPSFTLKEVIMDRISQLQIPALYGFSFGHITNQCTLPFGAVATMDTTTFKLKVTLP